MEENKKHIDESWKEQIEKEKKDPTPPHDFVPPEANFNFFVTTMALQASIALGQMPNPATQKQEDNLPQAKFIIDTLEMIQKKTKGNLDAEENTLLEDILYQLRMQYIEKNKGGSS
ncbi:MAG: DUF1844 domain-containing protein [Candidatus Omnitrophica bacterium]|nr:DUF1844 domain-containing protein [Candidatus Omnitrophota bacterium]